MHADQEIFISTPYCCRCGLDVFEDEPEMAPGLAECENAVVVPHIASASLWTRAGMVRAQVFIDRRLPRT